MSALNLNNLDEVKRLESEFQNGSTDSLDQDDQKEIDILNRLNSDRSSLTLDKDFKSYEEVLKLQQHLPDVKLTYGLDPYVPTADDDSETDKVFFFDIDNCLYKRSTKIHDLMQLYIHRFFKKNLNLNDEDAHQLHMKYYKEYGLAIEGLVRLHKIDALEYNKVVDDALPLDKILKPNPNLRKLLLELRRSGKVKRLWLFTNAYKNHALRVIKLLGLGDLFDGITYCDYGNFPLTCKPMKKAFDIALEQAGVKYPRNAIFIDDSGLNVKAAREFGWGKVIQFIELDEDVHNLKNLDDNEIIIIRDILDIEKAVPELF